MKKLFSFVCLLFCIALGTAAVLPPFDVDAVKTEVTGNGMTISNISDLSDFTIVNTDAENSNIVADSWYIAHNATNIFHYGKLTTGQVVSTGQPYLEYFNTEEDFLVRLYQLSPADYQAYIDGPGGGEIID